MRRTALRDGWSPSRPRQNPRRFRRFSFVLLVPLVFGVLASPAAQVTPIHADDLADARARQDTLNQQLKTQRDQIARITALQGDLSRQIASTKKELSAINADLTAVRKSIDQMVIRIEVVKAEYFALLGHLQLLANQLANVETQEDHKRSDLGQRKALLADRIRSAYDTDRTTLLETFLSGGSFTDVISEVGYINDFAEQDKVLAEQIVKDTETLATIHQTVESTRAQTDVLRIETEKQKAELDRQLVELKSAQARLKALEEETARALASQKATYATLLKNKKDLARAIATTAAGQKALAAKIDALVRQQYEMGNIPSEYNGSLKWPLSGTVTGEFGCSTYPGYGPGQGCEHFHNGIDIVAPQGCGAPIRAAGDGRIGYIGWNYADGADPAWIVIIVHSQDLQTWYAHMRAHTYPDGISAGAEVKTGQLIGYEDSTGRSTGCHLHWMVEYNGAFRNPRMFV
jgi:murein DD-endopeptidase MepM/ murein hydrolase activator NlpD